MCAALTTHSQDALTHRVSASSRVPQISGSEVQQTATDKKKEKTLVYSWSEGGN